MKMKCSTKECKRTKNVDKDMHGKNIKTSMHAKFQPIRTNRKKVMGVRNFDCLKSIKTQILKLEEKLRIIITWWQPAHLEAIYSQF